MLGYESASSSYLHISTGSPALEGNSFNTYRTGTEGHGSRACKSWDRLRYGALDHRGWDLMNKQKPLEHVTIANHHWFRIHPKEFLWNGSGIDDDPKGPLITGEKSQQKDKSIRWSLKSNSMIRQGSDSVITLKWFDDPSTLILWSLYYVQRVADHSEVIRWPLQSDSLTIPKVFPSFAMNTWLNTVYRYCNPRSRLEVTSSWLMQTMQAKVTSSWPRQCRTRSLLRGPDNARQGHFFVAHADNAGQGHFFVTQTMQVNVVGRYCIRVITRSCVRLIIHNVWS